MKLATLKNDTRDGQLIVVSKDLTRYQICDEVPTLQYALDSWKQCEPVLTALYKKMEADKSGQPLDQKKLHAPLPRAYEWIDGSAFINHIILVRKARNAEPAETLRTEPLVYQGGSGVLLGPNDPIKLGDESWGCDFESEVCVILDDTPQGVKASEVGKYIRLVMIANDVSLRNLIPAELQKGFGFFNSKPATAFSPVCVSIDELGSAWKDGRLHLPLITKYNDKKFGDPNAGPEMHFSFYDLIEHICKTRSLTAGTIVGSGTISNEDQARGSSCLAEKRMIEKIETGEFKTPFMHYGDKVEIEMFDEKGQSIFGAIKQDVVPM